MDEGAAMTSREVFVQRRQEVDHQVGTGDLPNITPGAQNLMLILVAENVQYFLREMLKRRNVIRGESRKRKASVRHGS